MKKFSLLIVCGLLAFWATSCEKEEHPVAQIQAFEGEVLLNNDLEDASPLNQNKPNKWLNLTDSRTVSHIWAQHENGNRSLGINSEDQSGTSGFWEQKVDVSNWQLGQN